jgi:ATP-binding cassette subfamily B (MDR/TAP) protein 6
MAANDMAWCGSLLSPCWLPGLSTCAFESAAATLVLLALLLSLLAQGGLLGLIMGLRRQGLVRHGVSGVNGAYIACAVFMTGSHLLHVGLSLALLRPWPFHVAFHSILAATWAAVLSLGLLTARLRACVDLRPVSAAAAVVYTLGLYVWYRLYFDPHSIPVAYAKAAIWTAMLQTVVSIVCTWLGFKRAALSPTTEELTVRDTAVLHS